MISTWNSLCFQALRLFFLPHFEARINSYYNFISGTKIKGLGFQRYIEEWTYFERKGLFLSQREGKFKSKFSSAFTLLKTFLESKVSPCTTHSKMTKHLRRAEFETHFVSAATYTVSFPALWHYEELQSSFGLYKGFGIFLHLCVLLREQTNLAEGQTTER